MPLSPTYFQSRFSSLLDVVPTTDAYDPGMAWLLGEMSHLAYTNFERDVGPRKRALTKGGFTLVRWHDGARIGTQAFVARRRDDALAVLCYRGTDHPRDWQGNLDIHRDEVEAGVKIHRGFLRAFRTVENDVAQDLAALNDTPLYICGHSLGGALAMLATYFFPRRPELSALSVRACYTYGGPRVGNSTFAKAMSRLPIHRIVREGDGVPEKPLGRRFQHAGGIQFFESTGRLLTEVSDLARITRLLRAVRQDIGVPGLAALKAHDHQSYADQLGEYALAHADPHAGLGSKPVESGI